MYKAKNISIGGWAVVDEKDYYIRTMTDDGLELTGDYMIALRIQNHEDATNLADALNNGSTDVTITMLIIKILAGYVASIANDEFNFIELLATMKELSRLEIVLNKLG